MSLPIQPRFPSVSVVGLLVGLAGCSWMAGEAALEPEPPPEPVTAEAEPLRAVFAEALGRAERGDFEEAQRELRVLATRCESGRPGRDAVLLLGSLELSPRNPGGDPGVASVILARYLQLPGPTEASRTLAETLYLLALDRGADPVEDPWNDQEGVPPIPLRFGDCDDPVPPWARPLPEHPGPSTTAETLRRARVQRDSLASVADSLAAELVRMDQELQRIRRLLLPDTTRSTDPGGSGR